MGDHSTIDHAGITGVGGGGDITADAAWAAKGDLIAASANDTAAVVSVGTNGSSLRAASGATSGVEWQKNNLAASVAPAVTDDVDLGYTVGSRWIDTTADKEYVCLDNTDGAAVWTETTQAGGGGGSPNCKEAFLTGNVTIVNANTAYDGPSLSLEAGDWLVMITMSFSSANTSQTHLVAQIYDGSAVVADASGYHGGGAGGGATFSCSARITLGSTTTVYARGVSIRGSSDSAILATALANGATNKATSIRAVQVTAV
jgi:hypothetical protein